MQNKKQAFTLVELIVVITILVILGTIAFLSFQGYSKSSRDSVRMSDLSTMKTSLELFSIKTGKYPVPTNPTPIVYSGSIEVWNQGTYGDSVVTNVDQMSKKPVDPLVNTEYTYSVLTNRMEFQLAAALEGDVVGGIGSTYAAGTQEAIAYVTGNYNGLITSITDNGTIYILAVPSIITSDVSNPDVSNIILTNKLVFDGYKNLPTSYESTQFKVDGGFQNGQTIVAVYSGGSIPVNEAEVDTLMANINLAYTGTLLADTDYISGVLNATGDELTVIGTQLVNQKLGGKVKADNTPPPVVYKSCKERLDAGAYTGNGVYNIDPNSDGGFDAYCDMTTDGGGWTMVVAQYPADPVTDWNEGIQGDYDPSLVTNKGFALNSSQLPVHSETAFGKDLDPTYDEYFDYVYTTGNIEDPTVVLTGKKSASSFVIHRDVDSLYGAHNLYVTTLFNIPDWNDSLAIDIEGATDSNNWGFAPNHGDSTKRGLSMVGNLYEFDNITATYAWTVWVR